MIQDDVRLIEKGFPCHQVGAETQRERGASSALPPLYFLHVWWARRPLTPSRAAIIASLDKADTDPETFVRQLGIERVQAEVNGIKWTLVGDTAERILKDVTNGEYLVLDEVVSRRLQEECRRREENRKVIQKLKEADPSFASDPVLRRWENESCIIPTPLPPESTRLSVTRIMGDPAHVRERIQFAGSARVKSALGTSIKWAPEDLFAYNRAFYNHPNPVDSKFTILDPTSGGGSIPFEALRLGHNVIANELNPVACTILHATLDYPARFGESLAEDINNWGNKLLTFVETKMDGFAPFSRLPDEERGVLKAHLKNCPDVFKKFDIEENDHTGQIFVREVVCPHCGGEAPLLNTCWLSKEPGDQWGVKAIPDGKERFGKVSFAVYRATNGRGPEGEDPELATVNKGVGQCIHCKQAIDGDEIKAQAQGISPTGKWKSRLYAVAAVRLEPVLDKVGMPVVYKSGERKGEIKTRKVRFFRAPNSRDLDAIANAESCLKEKWPEWEAAGLIPTEEIPPNSNYNRGHRLYGIYRWCDLFTPRQLLGHLILAEGLKVLKPQILVDLGAEKGKAVVTYLQFVIDKGLDYNCSLTRWEFTRGIVKGIFGSHNFSMKWTFGEMIFTGPASGARWALSQVVDAFSGIAKLAEKLHENIEVDSRLNLRIINGTAAHMPDVPDKSVDLVCADPPYYNNVMYAELSDFFYVWQKRTLSDLYPGIYNRRLTDKTNEAVANVARDGSLQKAKGKYEEAMMDIFGECGRVLKDDGIMTLMFTHKEQDAWEALTRSLIEAGWNITAAFPVESESEYSTHQKDVAAAASSIFIACRKRTVESQFPAVWTGLGGQGVQRQIETSIRDSLVEFQALKLNPVDEMVACYGRALRVLSENWPVMDGEDTVSPIRAMNEASRVVSENQISKITGGRISVDELDPETAMSLILYGVWGLNELAYDEALNISKSLNIALVGKAAGYGVEGRIIGINQDAGGRGRSSSAVANADETGFHAPLVRKGSKLRIAKPEERNARRLEKPLTDWDILHGVIQAYRKGDIPVARAYMEQHASQKTQRILDLLDVWGTEMDDQKLREEAKMIRFGLK